MKVSATFPAMCTPDTCAFMATVNSKVVEAWSLLPESLQKRVDWVGLEFIRETNFNDIQIVIKLNEEFNVDSCQAFLKPGQHFSVRNRPAEIEKVGTKFKETVHEMLKRMSTRLREHSEILATLTP